MRPFSRLATALLPVLVAGPAFAAAELVWEVSGLQNPESAVYDAAAGVIYVSDVAGDPVDKDGVGFIAKVSRDGKMIDAEWISGLNAPKGIALGNGRLYIADIDELVVVDIASGGVVKTYKAPDAKFLNDVTVDSHGRVYISDMMTDTIWKLEGDTFEAWLQDSSLDNPNGLLAVNGKILVASWGRMTDGFETKVPGHVKVIDVASMTVSPLGDTSPVGNLDGIVADGRGGYIVSDWMAGGLFAVGADGRAVGVIDLEQGSADIGIIEEEKLVIVPMMMHGSVAAYRVE